MRTTLTIDDDVLAAAKTIAAQADRSVGAVVSELARQSLKPKSSGVERNGIKLLRNSKAIVTLDIVNALRDELP